MYKQEKAAVTIQKCSQHCIADFKDDSLLPSEERCLRNCYIKALELEEYLDTEMRYTIRTMSTE